MSSQAKTVSFTQMKDGTKEEYELLRELEKPYVALTADRVLDELRVRQHWRATGSRGSSTDCRRPRAPRRRAATSTGLSARYCMTSATGLRRRTTTASPPR